MKRKNATVFYESPKVEIVDIVACQILCQSDGVGTTPFDDGGSIDQNWN